MDPFAQEDINQSTKDILNDIQIDVLVDMLMDILKDIWIDIFRSWKCLLDTYKTYGSTLPASGSLY
jgi:hypothetical protein